MLNISLCFNRKDFEYDVYSLIKAFYPGCEITSWYEEDGAPDGEFAYYDTITYVHLQRRASVPLPVLQEGLSFGKPYRD